MLKHKYLRFKRVFFLVGKYIGGGTGVRQHGDLRCPKK